jgi:hypothetical protein
MAGDAIDRRAANALFRPGGGMREARAAPLRFGGPYRGLWIGGTATLTAESLAFEPNRLNRLLLRKAARSAIPLGEIQSARTGRGFYAGVVEVETAEGMLSLRCIGAGAFARSVREAAGLAEG